MEWASAAHFQGDQLWAIFTSLPDPLNQISILALFQVVRFFKSCFVTDGEFHEAYQMSVIVPEHQIGVEVSWQVGCFSRPCQDSFALFNEDGLSMTVRYVAIIFAPLCGCTSDV